MEEEKIRRMPFGQLLLEYRLVLLLVSSSNVRACDGESNGVGYWSRWCRAFDRVNSSLG
jgi:hypothetical protein